MWINIYPKNGPSLRPMRIKPRKRPKQAFHRIMRLRAYGTARFVPCTHRKAIRPPPLKTLAYPFNSLKAGVINIKIVNTALSTDFFENENI